MPDSGARVARAVARRARAAIGCSRPGSSSSGSRQPTARARAPQHQGRRGRRGTGSSAQRTAGARVRAAGSPPSRLPTTPASSSDREERAEQVRALARARVLGQERRRRDRDQRLPDAGEKLRADDDGGHEREPQRAISAVAVDAARRHQAAAGVPAVGEPRRRASRRARGRAHRATIACPTNDSRSPPCDQVEVEQHLVNAEPVHASNVGEQEQPRGTGERATRFAIVAPGASRAGLMAPGTRTAARRSRRWNERRRGRAITSPGGATVSVSPALPDLEHRLECRRRHRDQDPRGALPDVLDRMRTASVEVAGVTFLEHDDVLAVGQRRRPSRHTMHSST